MDRQPGAFPDLEGLADGREQVPALAADVRRVQPADSGGRGRERDDLVGPTDRCRGRRSSLSTARSRRRPRPRGRDRTCDPTPVSSEPAARGRAPPVGPSRGRPASRGSPRVGLRRSRRGSRASRTTPAAGSRPVPRRPGPRPRPTPPAARARTRSSRRRPTSPLGARCSASRGAGTATGRSGCGRRRIPAPQRGHPHRSCEMLGVQALRAVRRRRSGRPRPRPSLRKPARRCRPRSNR